MTDEQHMTEMQDAVSDVVTDAVKERQMTLIEQLAHLRDAERHWWDRLAEAKLSLRETYERRAADINNACLREIHEATVAAERRRDEDLRMLGENYQRKLGDFAALTQARA